MTNSNSSAVKEWLIREVILYPNTYRYCSTMFPYP